MADKANSTKNQVKEITDRLEQGIKDLFSGEKYLSYLQTMSRFHRYSTRNTLLIYMQKPDATLVAGYRSWQSKFGRYVKRGESGIKILAPTPFTITKEQQKLDPDTRRPILGTDGLPVTEEVEVHIARFKVIPVFDVSQTDGKPLPKLVEDLTGDVKHYALFLDALRAVSLLPIQFESLEPGTDGVCRMGDSIAIRTGMSEIQTVSAVIHEITHARLHDLERLQQQDETAKPKDRRTEEVEAESVSYAVCQYYGLETAANSFGYLAEWSKNRDLKELNASLDIIRKTAAELIDSIDENFRMLAKERGIDLTPKEQDETAPEPSPVPDDVKTKIEETARTTEMSVSATQDAPEQDVKTEAPPREQETPDGAEQDSSLPDPAIGLSERNQYGYTDPSMLPLQKDRALALYDADHTVYMLYPDNTEAMVFERDEIAGHDGIFGIEAEEWQASREYVLLKDAARNNEASREARLLYGDRDSFGIFQLKSGEELHFHRFTSLEQLKKDGLTVDRANYELVYVAPLSLEDTLEGIFEKFNLHHPADFRGHSLSVSDVVSLQRNDEITSHYVDSYGFKELPAFIGNEHQAPTYSQVGNTPEETAPEPTVSELEAQVKAGKQISLLDLAMAAKNEQKQSRNKEKPSILAQLQEGKRAALQGADTQKTAPKRDSEREV